ncbi:MAG TPA: hypothetical protein VKF60_03630 [Myxococcota bacterium]|nr:hypothetical protein [Myxococcota bacterium]
MALRQRQLQELLLQSLETERGGLRVYETAIECALNDDLREEWEEYLEQTRRHERIVARLLEQLGLEELETPGRRAVRMIGESLVGAMRLARNAPRAQAKALASAQREVEPEEDEHLYHSAGWCRELWLLDLGLPAVLPPPEEEREGSYCAPSRDAQ